MGIIKIIFVSIIGVLFIAIVLVVATSTRTERSVNLRLPDNHIVMDNITLVRNLDDNGSYTLMVADSAYYDRITNALMLTDFALTHNDGELLLSSRAERGEYKAGFSFKATGDIEGRYNDVEYSSGADGEFVYDFRELYGDMSGKELHFARQGSSVSADKAKYNGANGQIVFEGNVYVEYIPDEDNSSF